MDNKKNKLQYNIILILFPLIILTIIEFALRIIGYGDNPNVFIKAKYINDMYLENLYVYNKYVERENHVKGKRLQPLSRFNYKSRASRACLKNDRIKISTCVVSPYLQAVSMPHQ